MSTCPAEIQGGSPRKAEGTFTVRCQKPEGHNGAHEHRFGGAQEGRVTTWYGEPKKADDWAATRFRFGFEPGWLNK